MLARADECDVRNPPQRVNWNPFCGLWKNLMTVEKLLKRKERAGGCDEFL
jgi:hypothetical protein